MKKRDTIKNIKTNMIIKGLSKIKNAWKNHDIIINQVELKNGDISGTFEGKLNMEKSKKITNQDIMNSMNEQFKQVNEQFKQVNEQFKQVNDKIDLIINCPTIQKEIDHNALRKLN